MKDEVQLRILASGILYRATLRALPRAPSAEEKMRLHARVEEAAWAMDAGTLAHAEGRDVDDGAPEAWAALVARLAGSDHT